MKHYIDCIIAVPSFQDKNMKHVFSNTEMLGPEYIAASVEYNGYSVNLLNAYSDEEISDEKILEEIRKLNPIVVGVTCASQRSYPFVKHLVKSIRENGYEGKIVVGGFYATLEPEHILTDLDGIDAINLGEGEVSFAEIVKSLKNTGELPEIDGIAYKKKNGEICVRLQRRLRNIDFAFFPKRTPIKRNAVSNMVDGTYIKGKYYNMIVGRGCYGRCSFCSIHKSYESGLRVYRSAKNVVDEMEILRDKYGIEHIWFNDEIFYDRSKNGIKWLNSFCDELEARKLGLSFNIELRPNDINEKELKRLKDVGLTAIFVGIESGIQRVLDEMRKDTTVEENCRAIEILKKLDIKLEMGWISLVPTMTFEELCENYKFLLSTDCYTEENIYNRFNLYGGCYYEEILKEKQLLEKDSSFYDRFGYDFADVRVGHFTEIIDNMRADFKEAKRKTMPIQRKISIEGDYAPYLEIRKIQRAIWTWLIPEVLECFKENEQLEWKQFVQMPVYNEFLKKVHDLEKEIDAIGNQLCA